MQFAALWRGKMRVEELLRSAPTPAAPSRGVRGRKLVHRTLGLPAALRQPISLELFASTVRPPNSNIYPQDRVGAYEGLRGIVRTKRGCPALMSGFGHLKHFQVVFKWRSKLKHPLVRSKDWITIRGMNDMRKKDGKTLNRCLTPAARAHSKHESPEHHITPTRTPLAASA